MRTLIQILLAFLFIGGSAIAQTPVFTQLCQLPIEVTETSGLENGPNGWFWTHNDSGNPAEVYCVDTTGVIQRTVSVVGDVNTDWEDVAKDASGNLYIGNFGNNSLNRTDLRIVKIPSIDTCTISGIVSDTIRFSYPDQFNFPPNGSYGNFDMEAFFWYADSLHLFSKDRSNPGTGYTKHYRLPTTGGTYQALLLDSFQIGNTSYIFSVTSADISEDGSRMALLNADHVWLFSNYTGTDFFGGDVAVLSLGAISQKEAICFRGDFLYITDEEAFGQGRKLYRLNPNMFVGVEEMDESFHIRSVYGNDLRLSEIRWEMDETVHWQLYSTDGRLLKEGDANRSLKANQLNQPSGSCVIRISTSKGNRSILVRL